MLLLGNETNESRDWLDEIAPVPRLVGAGVFREGVINPWRIIADHELFMFRNGEARLVIDGQDYSCCGPCFVIIPPGLQHISYCMSEETELFWAHFAWIAPQVPTRRETIHDPFMQLDMLCNLGPEMLPNQVLHGPFNSAAPFELHRQVQRSLQTKDLRRHRLARGIFLSELLELLEPSTKETVRVNRSEVLANSTRDCLTAIASQPFDQTPLIKDALEELGTSYFHQVRIFKEIFGMSPQAYIAMLRIERIKALLLDTDLSIKVIATRLGYHDFGYFSRFFSRQVGESPSVYRKTR